MPPPEEETQPTDSELNAVIEWIDRQLLTTGSGEAYRKKLLSPDYGNWVNHESYSLVKSKLRLFPLPALAVQRSFTHKGFGKAKSPFGYVTSERGIRDYAALSLADQSTVQMTMIVADSFLADREDDTISRFCGG